LDVNLSELIRTLVEYLLLTTATGLGEDALELLLLDSEGSLQKTINILLCE
jgi:hypothetical protein